MKKLFWALAAFIALTIPAAAQQFPGKYQVAPPVLLDRQGTSPLTDSNSRLITKDMCDSSAAISVAAAAVQEIVALTAAQSIYVCSFVITGDTLATTGQFRYGTGTTCGSGTVNLTGAMRMPDEGGIFMANTGYVFKTIAANAFCISAVTGAITGFIEYTKF